MEEKSELKEKVVAINMDNINPFLFIILPHLMTLNTC